MIKNTPAAPREADALQPTPPRRRNLITPATALDLMGGMRANRAKEVLMMPIASGIIYAQADAITSADADGQLVQIRDARVRQQLWTAVMRENVGEQLWSTGSVAMPAQAYSEGGLVSLTGITLDADGVAKQAAKHNCAPRPPRSNVGGRPTAKWWAAFAEELAVYLHQHGVPDGVGSEGQGEIIEAVKTKMSERGCHDVPERSSIQGVVQATIDRLRSDDPYDARFGFE